MGFLFCHSRRRSDSVGLIRESINIGIKYAIILTKNNGWRPLLTKTKIYDKLLGIQGEKDEIYKKILGSSF